MNKRKTHIATDRKDRLLLMEFNQDKYGGYKQDLMENDLDEMEMDFYVCSRCNGVMRNACLVNGPDQILVCEVCLIEKEGSIPIMKARKNILELRAKCPLLKRGCVWKGILGEIDVHLDECIEFILGCTNRCDVILKRSELQNHYENECQLRIVKCKYCGITIQYKELENHYKICLECPLLCPNECLKSLIRKELKSHIDEECPNTLVACPYKEMGCEVLSKRFELQKHENIFEPKHFEQAKAFYPCKINKMKMIIQDQKHEINLLAAILLNIEKYLESKKLLATTLTTEESRDTNIRKPFRISSGASKKQLATNTKADQIKRILQELSYYQEHPHPAFEVFPGEEHIDFWRIIMEGPEGTPYEGGIFELFIEFTDEYPSKPPNIRFITPIYHCNINSSGRIFCTILDRLYTPGLRVGDIFNHVYGLLSSPEKEDPLDSVKASLLRDNSDKYFQEAKKYTLQHAKKTKTDVRIDPLGQNVYLSYPPFYVCPLTLQLFKDPVSTLDGDTYEREAILEHLRSGKNYDPFTFRKLDENELHPNKIVQKAVSQYKKEIANIYQ